jgi:hypothetical protein
VEKSLIPHKCKDRSSLATALQCSNNWKLNPHCIIKGQLNAISSTEDTRTTISTSYLTIGKLKAPKGE